MSAEQDKATVLRFYEEVWNKGNVDFAFEVFAEDYVRHDLRSTEALPGPEGQRKIAAEFRAAFPDLEWDVDLILAEGDLVAGRWTARGTNTGPWGGAAPTGKRAETIYLVLPLASAVGEYGELSDEDLEAVAGGQASWDEPCDTDTNPYPTQPLTCGV